jgi:polysulfide reductase chain C
MEHLFTWNYLIAIYLFTAGLSSGAAIIAAITDIINHTDDRIKRLAAYLAPFPVMLGLACLVADLHRPLNFFKVLIHYNPTSVMSWGAFFLLVFPLIAVVYAIMVYFNYNGALRKITAWLELVLGLAIGIYAGLLLAAIYNNPVWSNPLIVFLFFISALSTGLCMIILGGKLWDLFEERIIRRIIPQKWLPAPRSLNLDHANIRLLVSIDAVIIIIELMVISTLIISYALRPTGEIALGAIITGGYYLTFWIGVVLIGLIAPLILALLELQNKLDDSMSTLIAWIEPALILFGGFLLRYVIVYGGQLVYPILTFYK